MIGHSLKNIFDSLGFAYDFAFCQNKWSSKNLQNVSWKMSFKNDNIYQSFQEGGGDGKNFQKKQVPVQIWRIHQICISCFLIDMKFKSNPVCCLVMENVSFLILLSTKNMLGKNHKCFSKNGGYTFQSFRKFPNFQILRYQKIICFKDDSMIFLVFFEVFW